LTIDIRLQIYRVSKILADKYLLREYSDQSKYFRALGKIPILAMENSYFTTATEGVEITARPPFPLWWAENCPTAREFFGWDKAQRGRKTEVFQEKKD
jgi:hypothetical protein